MLSPVTETIGKKYDKKGVEINPEVPDSVEDFFNMLGSEGWELVTAVNLDSGVNSPLKNSLRMTWKISFSFSASSTTPHMARQEHSIFRN